MIKTCCATTLLLLSLASNALGAGANTSGSDSIEGVELQIQQTSERLKQLDAEIATSRDLKEKLEQSLANVESNVGERQARIQELDRDIEHYNSKLTGLEQRVEHERQTVTLRKQLLADSLRRSQQVGKGSGLKLVLRNDDPVLADRLRVYTDYFMRAQRQEIDEQITALRTIENAHEIALKDRNWLNYIKNKAASQHDSFATQRDLKRQSIGEVEIALSQKTRSVAELKADQQRLQTLMDELKAAQALQSGYFEAGKGRYSLPVDGTVDARFGEVKSMGKLTWNGIFVLAEGGQPVRAVADGEVVYSDWLSGFGMLVIVDHGDGFMTLYGGNRDVTVPKGTYVESGATIATVGDSGGQKASGVYFEIRHNAKPVNPEDWISAENGVRSAKK